MHPSGAKQLIAECLKTLDFVLHGGVVSLLPRVAPESCHFLLLVSASPAPAVDTITEDHNLSMSTN